MKKFMISIAVIVLLTFSGCANNKINIDKNNKKKINKSLEAEKNTKTNEKTRKLNILVSDKILYDCVKSIDKGKHNVDYIFKRNNNEVLISHYYDIGYVPDLYIYDEFNLPRLNNNYISKIEDKKVGIINAYRGGNHLSYYKNVDKYGKEKYSLVWSNIDNYKVVLVNIKNAIIDKDPKNRSYYEKNFNEAVKNLETYEKVFKEEGNKIKDFSFIVEGDYLDYMLGYMGLKTISISENDYKNINLKNIIDSKYNKAKNQLVLIYYNDNFLESNKDAILKYNIKCIKINKVNLNSKYQDLLENQKKFLETAVNVCTKR